MINEPAETRQVGFYGSDDYVPLRYVPALEKFRRELPLSIFKDFVNRDANGMDGPYGARSHLN